MALGAGSPIHLSSRIGAPLVQVSSKTRPPILKSFTDLLATALEAAATLQDDDGVLSLAIPLVETRDPMVLLPHLPGNHRFRFLWDGAPGLCLAASGQTHRLALSGPRRFELAQEFSAVSLGRLGTTPQTMPPMARPRILLTFSFFDTPLQEGQGASGVEAVLPRWQLSRQGRHCWLRLQRPLGGDVTPRSIAEELWEQARRLEALPWHLEPPFQLKRGPGIVSSSPWQGGYRAAVGRGLELVESGVLRKLVLAVRQHLELDQPLDPLRLLAHLRQRQPGSCRFLWQQGEGAALLGASPERLLAVRQGRLHSDALAGTAPIGPLADQLTSSSKDRLEHELVVEAITQALWKMGLAPHRPSSPRLAQHGQLVHLHTPITSAMGDQQPLALAEALHPTPAVAGLPQRQAMAWLRSLEPFERGHYAAPIGWIDNGGDAELRVAIRSGSLLGRQLVLTAGAGLVRGSVPERELQEVALKLGVLQQQLNLPVTEHSGIEHPPKDGESGRE